MPSKTAVLKVTDEFQSLVVNPVNSGNTVNIVTFIVSNISDSSAFVDIKIERNGDDEYNLLKSGLVPVNKSSSVFLNKDSGVYLEPGDSLKIKADGLEKIDAVCSYTVD